MTMHPDLMKAIVLAAIAETHRDIWCSIGIHPHEAAEEPPVTAYVPFHLHTSHFPRTDARYTRCATSEAAPSATFRAAQCAACRASHDTDHTSHH